MNHMKVGQFIAECRKKKDLTQAQLAEKLNITDRAISKWENGKAMPVEGSRLVTTPRFRIVWTAISVINPAAKTVEKRSGACSAIQKPRKIRAMNNKIISKAPKSPTSSQMTAKI